MVFNNAHDFYIHQLNAVDGQSKEVRRLVDAACPGAGHLSAERGDAPKCHPDTRKAVLNDIMSWVDSTDSSEPLMWVSGPAGAGKSSIAQTVCERCDAEKKLLASFFFSRSAVGTGRDDGNRLIPTIAIQLAIVIPETKGHIIEKLEKVPLLLTYPMEEQMRQLVLEPLAAAQSNYEKTQYLVVIDGLDECFDRDMQAKIITMFSAIGLEGKTGLRCIIASRPELEIRNTLESVIHTRIVLDAHYDPDRDIRVYLLSEFSSLKRKHTLKSHLVQDSKWPTSEEIGWLLARSSGQFIFASTIVKYLQDPRRNPRDSLRDIIEHKISERGRDEQSVYSPLDALYKFILESAALNLRQLSKQSLVNVLQVLLYGTRGVETRFVTYPSNYWTWSTSDLALFLSLEIPELKLLLSDLHSILLVPDEDYKPVGFHHASLDDFLKDPSRSGHLYISPTGAHKVLGKLCFHQLSKGRRSRDENHVRLYCLSNYLSHTRRSGNFPLLAYFLIRGKLMRLEARERRENIKYSQPAQFVPDWCLPIIVLEDPSSESITYRA